MSPRHSANGSFLQGATEIILAHLDDEHFGVSELATKLGMSRSNLHRKIHTLTGNSASQFIREVRLDKARELLQDAELTVSEVAYRVGFGSATYFSKCFHDHFGYPPGEADERDVQKVPPADSLMNSNTSGPQKRRFPIRWVILVSMLVLAAIAMILLFNPFSLHYNSKDISVAILPFRNNSPEQKNDYIINGLVEEIQFKLSRVEGLNVVPRTTMELYRDSEKSIRQIAREVNADYILEGSATILNNHTRIRLQLIDPSSNSNIWSEPYDREITMENIFEIHEEIALEVTDGLDIFRNQEITELVQHKPTENPEAYDLYNQARNLIRINRVNFGNEYASRALKAKQLLETAISLDSTFADAYTFLANVYIGNEYFWYIDSDLEKAYAYLDTGFYVTNKALHFYEKKSKRKRPADQYYQYALALKGGYYLFNGDRDQANYYYKESREGLKRSYKDYLGDINWYYLSNDFYNTIKNYLIFYKLKPEDTIVDWWIHQDMYEVFRQAGFFDLSKDQAEMRLALIGDSLEYLGRIVDLEMWSGNYSQAIDHIEKLMDLSPDNVLLHIPLSRTYLYMGNFDAAAGTILDMVDQLNERGLETPDHWLVGYIYYELGRDEMADSLLNWSLNYQLSRLQYYIPFTLKGITPFIIARDYSIKGDKEKTLEYLEYLKDTPGADYYYIHELKNWPSFDLVRDTPEYKEILADLERRFNKEHDRIERLLRKEGYI